MAATRFSYSLRDVSVEIAKKNTYTLQRATKRSAGCGHVSSYVLTAT
jgi:hypothetical protein